jgi:Zn-dependent protease
MLPGNSASPMAGSFRLFRVGGITVSVHWTWLLVAAFELQYRAGAYALQFWNVAEYLALFAIVLLHEFGHALACRSVGGRADHIVLWPLGGVAFVAPPPRPGAWLWSIAAGPLVNVVLRPITIGALYLAGNAGMAEGNSDVYHFVGAVADMNLVLLLFNLLPVYPLDGGQILQALLWFVIGRVKSLLVVSVIGLVVGAVAVVATLASGQMWLVVMSAFVALRSWAGFRYARMLAAAPAVPRRREATCPGCGAHPPVGEFWTCDRCRTRFDTFAERAACPTCGKVFVVTTCPDCHRGHPMPGWLLPGGAGRTG